MIDILNDAAEEMTPGEILGKTHGELEQLQQQAGISTRFESENNGAVRVERSISEGSIEKANQLHAVAKKEFTQRLEKILKDPNNNYEISDFGVGIGLVEVDGKKRLVLIYRVNLKKSTTPDRMISIRGKLHQNKDSLQKLWETDVIPWIDRMKQVYPGVKFEESLLVEYGGYFFRELLARSPQ